jgi:hypothetical protein
MYIGERWGSMHPSVTTAKCTKCMPCGVFFFWDDAERWICR